MDDKRLPARALYCHDVGNMESRKTKIWMENVRQDLKEQDMNMKMALDTIRDGKIWSHLVQISSSAHT